MSLLTEAPAIGEVGLAVAERCAPEFVAASKAMVEDALGQIFKKPLPLSEALPKLAEVFTGNNSGEITDYLPKIARIAGQDSRIARINVTRMLGTGANDIALATEYESALKIGLGPLPRPIHNPLFDAPVLDHGKLELGVRYYMQPIGETGGVTDRHVLSVMKKLRSVGYLEEDAWTETGTRHDQVALFGKTPLLIDQGSAVPRYGMMVKDGSLVPHPEQQINLAEMQEYLHDHRIPLLQQKASRPVNPFQTGGMSITRVMDDSQLAGDVRDYLSMIGRPPTMYLNWSYDEVLRGLKTLTLSP